MKFFNNFKQRDIIFWPHPLLFPFLMFFLSFFSRKTVRFIVICICAYLFYKYRNFHKIDMMDGRFVPFYFWVFLGGSITCFVYKWSLEKKALDSRSAEIIFGLLSVLVLLFVYFSSTHMIKVFWKPLLPFISDDLKLNGWHIPHIWLFLFMLLMFAVTRYENIVASRFLKSYFFRHTGLLSYSLYLFHMPILLKMRKSGFSSEGMFVIIFAITYVVAIFSYLMVEKPCLRLKCHLVQANKMHDRQAG